MNFVKKINEMENSTKEDFYLILTEFFNDIEQEIMKVSNHIIDDITNDINVHLIQTKKETIEIKRKFKNNICIFNVDADLTKICRKYLYKLIDTIDKNILEVSLNYVNSKKDLNMLFKRRLFLINKYGNYFDVMKHELVTDLANDIITFVNENKIINDKINQQEIIKEDDITYESTKNKLNRSFIIKKIFNYKNLEMLAINNGYEYKWANGSHRIFENKITNKIIVIPTHTIGLGLSIKIQKQIYKNKIV